MIGISEAWPQTGLTGHAVTVLWLLANRSDRSIPGSGGFIRASLRQRTHGVIVELHLETPVIIVLSLVFLQGVWMRITP